MKKCLFCAEEIQDEALKCRHCGESVHSDLQTHSPKNQASGGGQIFDNFKNFIANDYPAFSVASENYEKKYLILHKQKRQVSCLLLTFLLLLWILPGIIYAIVAMGKPGKNIAILIRFDKKGNPISINNQRYIYLITNYKRQYPVDQ